MDRCSPINGFKRGRAENDLSSPVSDKKPKLLTSVDSVLLPQKRTPEAYKPIISPIKLSSDSHSDESASPQSQSNGYPHNLSNDDAVTAQSRKRHYHKHRSSSSSKRRHHHHRQHHRDRSRSRERSSERKHNRHHHHREDKLLSRMVSKEYGRSRKSDPYYR